MALWLKSQRKNRAASDLARYLKDPVGFVEERLLGFLWSKQKDIARSVVSHRRTAVKSCHDVGKTALAARIGAWWLSVHKPGDAFLVTSAPTFAQVKALLWREINRVHGQGRLPGRVNQTEWLFGNEIVGFGRSPPDTDPTAFQGIHARYVLVVLDEACGIAKTLWDAADTLIANDDSRILVIGNPDDPATEFHEVCKPGSGWNVIRIAASMSPNFTGEAVPDWLSPLLVGKTWVEEKRRRWGEKSPLYISKVDGEFPEQSEDGLLSFKDLRAAVERSLPAEGDNELGVDVARFGGDATIIYHRMGPVARKVGELRQRDLMQTVALVLRCVAKTGATRVKIDDAGMGGGVTDRLKELRMEGAFDAQLVPVNVGEKATTTEDATKFMNLRAQLNWGLRELFHAGLIDIADDDDLLAQASSIRYKFTSANRILIESKEDMKKRGLPSPDHWDALVLCFANYSSFDTSYRWVGAEDEIEKLYRKLGFEEHVMMNGGPR